jgi:hypothetical protein
VQTFQYPVPPAPPTAVLVPWFGKGMRWRGTVRVFHEGWGPASAAFAPAAIAGTFEQICALERIGVPSLTHALIVLSRPGEARLSEADRERLWRVFHVPVFEQVIGAGGELLAAECEAHDGLHVELAGLPLAGEEVVFSACPCGRKTPRIGVPKGVALLRRVAAYAR